MAVTPKNSRGRGLPRFRFFLRLLSSLLVGLVIASTLFILWHSIVGMAPPPTKPSLHELNTVKGTQLVKPSATSKNDRTKVNPDFSFTAAGDYGQTSYTTANLSYIAHSGAKFHLGLGDFDYDPSTSANAWSAYAKSHLPANFPFEIVAGGHDTQIDTLIADFPDRIGHISGTYGKEYSFDYPPEAPLARFIIITPSEILPGYDYGEGSVHYNWVAQTIDGARAARIRWVIVGMHQYCFVIDSKSCPNQDLLDLLLNKKVDVILQAQKHTYQASKQLALNNTTCPTLPITYYNAHCVVNATKSLTAGAGSVIVVTGTGGTVPMLSIDSSDPKINYFRSWMGANVNQTFGVSQFTVTLTHITMKFVPLSGGTFTDGFTLENGPGDKQT
jgi:hypothetical protein